MADDQPEPTQSFAADGGSGDEQKEIGDLREQVRDLQKQLGALSQTVAQYAARIIFDRGDQEYDHLDGALELQRHRIDELYRRREEPTQTQGTSTTSSDCDEWVVLKDGGSNGAVGSWPTLTYTLKDKNSGATIATGVAMTGRGKRLSPMPITEGTRGRGYYNSLGDPVLTWVDETYDYNFCIGS
jgi:hypothetical protein